MSGDRHDLVERAAGIIEPSGGRIAQPVEAEVLPAKLAGRALQLVGECPFPPRRMRIDAAAYYVGVSESTFRSRVEAGTYPPGIKEEGAVFYLRDDLDKMVDRQFGIHSDASQKEVTKNAFLSRFAQG